jgi:antitoxin component YwqK of YwqJK toxin-antitoxin module
MKYILTFLVILIVCGCKHLERHIVTHAPNAEAAIVSSTDPLLGFKNGFWYHGNSLFTGTIIEYFKDHSVHQSGGYVNGKEDGWKLSFYPGGALSEKRYFTNGEKDSIHTGWWQNGNKRFEYHFAKGIYNGDYKEWYQSGRLLKHIYYINGSDTRGKGWRESGKLYMNYVMKAGRRYGIVNSNLCYTVKNGTGEYVASVTNSK